MPLPHFHTNFHFRISQHDVDEAKRTLRDDILDDLYNGTNIVSEKDTRYNIIRNLGNFKHIIE